jgi:small subunit ribosomal protein S6
MMYETIVILNPNIANEMLEKKIADWTQLIQDFGSEISRIERWGKKNLAFDVKQFHQGVYVLFHIEGNCDAIAELERRFRIADEVIRYQTVKMSDIEYKTSNELLDSMKSRFAEDIKKESVNKEEEGKNESMNEDTETSAPAETTDPSIEKDDFEGNKEDDPGDKETVDKDVNETR